jgi:hypothetical protein
MVKFGKDLGIPYLICLNHTLHLAVMDEIFSKKPIEESTEDDSEEDFDDSEEISDEIESEEEVEVFSMDQNYSKSLKKMGEIIKIFPYSPLKWSVFEAIREKEGKQSLKFIISVKARWNSVVESGKRFLELLPITLKVLQHRDIKSDITWYDFDTENLQEICNVLEPVRVSTESLSKSDINLLEGEGILKFLVKEIEHAKANSPSRNLAKKFSAALTFRLQTRRDKIFQSLILYLSNRDSLKNYHPLELASKSQTIKFGLEMMRRLFPKENSNSENPSLASSSSASSLQDRLKIMVGSVQSQQISTQQNDGDRFKKEFDYFDRHHIHGPFLSKLYESLLSAQPTSTQSERNFSLAASIATKKRAKLSSENLNACLFLKSFFKNSM